MSIVAVTGATGVLGSNIVKSLVEAGYKVRAGSRNSAKVSQMDGVDPMTFDYEKSETLLPFLRGAQSLVLMAPPMDARAPHLMAPVIAAAVSSDVKSVVLVSALGADADPESPLAKAEALIRASDLAYAIVRPNFFMDNFTKGFLAHQVATGSIYLAAGDAKTSFIATKDIADVITQIHKGQMWGKELNLTGPEALDRHEAATIITELKGTKVQYIPIPEEAMLDGARKAGMPEPPVQYMATLYRAVRAGYTAPILNTISETLGRAPTDFRSFISESK